MNDPTTLIAHHSAARAQAQATAITARRRAALILAHSEGRAQVIATDVESRGAL